MLVKNIYGELPIPFKDEFFEEIISSANFKLERIVSEGHTSPEGFWYDQENDEFVLLLSGSAEIVFEDGLLIQLKPGDYLTIPAHKKHRVEKTDPNQKTFWLTLHFQSGNFQNNK